jgi:hypothetical protein
LASVRAAGAVLALLLADPPALVLLPLPLEAAVVLAPAVVLLPDDLLSPPQAASRAARPAPALPSKTERRLQAPPNPKVPGSTGGMVSSW